MDPKLIALLSLRALGTVTGNVALSNGIGLLMDAYDAGKNIDAHLEAIADKLEAGEDLDNWDDITNRIDAEVDDFLDEGSPFTDDPPDPPVPQG